MEKKESPTPEEFKCANKEDHNKSSCKEQCAECYDIYREKTASRKLAESIVDNLKNGSGNYLIYPEITQTIDFKIQEYRNQSIKGLIEEVEKRQVYWKNHGNYYICGGLQEAIELLKSKIK
jgi:hypothetical protein